MMKDKKQSRSIGLEETRSLKKKLLKWEWLLVLLFVVVNIMNISISPNYLKAANLASTMKIFLDKGIIAITMCMVLMLGEIDISVGSIMALSGTMMGLVGSLGANFIVIVVTGIVIGSLCGLLNGFLASRLSELDSTIITLSNSIFFRGIAYVILENRAYAEFPTQVKFMSWGTLFGLPFILVFFILEILLIAYLVHFTKFGRSLYAIGLNEGTSRYSGIRTNRIKTIVFMINGMAAGISSLFLISKLGNARATMARNYDMDIIAMVVLGGVAVSGGKGTVMGVALSVFIMGLLKYGLGLVNVSSQSLMIITGILLIFLVAIPNIKKFLNESRIIKGFAGRFKKEKKTT